MNPKMLLEPDDYIETEISRVIAEEIDTVFPGYLPIRNSRVLDYLWKPDFVGVHHKEQTYLIGEVKCRRPYWKVDSSIAQLVGYGMELYQERPTLKARLLLVGPWHKETGLFCVESFHGLPIYYGYMNMAFLGTLLENNMRSAIQQAISAIPFSDYATAFDTIEKLRNDTYAASAEI